MEGDRAVGVVTAGGETLRAAAVISNLNPKLLYLDLIAPPALPAQFREHMSHYRCGSGTFRMNVALSELPDFTCLPGKSVRRSPHRRHHHRPDARLHGARLLRRPRARLVARADRRGGHSLDAG